MTEDPNRNALLTVGEMAEADAAAVAGGITVETLMEAAGAAVVAELRKRWSPRPVVVLCGPGNNGGDGLVIARLLQRAAWDVRVAPLKDLSIPVLDGAELVVDALFGAGLSRPIDGAVREVVEMIDKRRLPCVAVDIPSGVHGDTGEVLGAAPRCELTVTFFRLKPGHLLLPGRALCGETVLADIGIPDDVIENIAPRAFVNGPELWFHRFPWPRLDDHKYSRGHAVILGGAEMTGAARLAARGAMRAGAGILTVASAPSAVPIYATALENMLVRPVATPEEFAKLLDDKRKNAVLVGPGAGVNRMTREAVLASLAAGRAAVLDADAITVFEDDPEGLFAALRGRNCLLTPHEGEFSRLFEVQGGNKLSRARAAAVKSGAAILLKGADTVIASPDGRAVVNRNAPPPLATAGSGDVLSGLALGLLAQGMNAFDAGCAAAWLHGEAATNVGPGLVASDLPDALPSVLRELAARRTKI
jgi:NAD(P)H-hydrate epimerase